MTVDGSVAPWLRLRSRVLDRVAALVLGPALAPVLAGAAAVARRDGPPAFVGLPRVGRDGRSFTMWKVRTMAAGSRTTRAPGPVLTASSGDARITPAGRWLRARRLDELPQVLNVARGEMALLGSRPETPELVDPDDPRWHHILRVPPGITGATQLLVHDWEEEVLAGTGHVERYRDDVLPVKLAIDAWYVRRGTPLLDAAIVVAMVERFVLGRRETVVHRWVRREVPEAAAVPGPAAVTTRSSPRRRRAATR